MTDTVKLDQLKTLHDLVGQKITLNETNFDLKLL